MIGEFKMAACDVVGYELHLQSNRNLKELVRSGVDYDQYYQL